MNRTAQNNTASMPNGMAWERRREQRAPLEPLATVTLHGAASGNEYLCTIANISPLGVMAELLCGETFAGLTPGQELLVTCCDESLQDLVHPRRLEVVWRREARAGLQFDQALPLEGPELRERLDRQRLLPWTEWRP